MNLYERWILPPILDLIMRQKHPWNTGLPWPPLEGVWKRWAQTTRNVNCPRRRADRM